MLFKQRYFKRFHIQQFHILKKLMKDSLNCFLNTDEIDIKKFHGYFYYEFISCQK